MQCQEYRAEQPPEEPPGRTGGDRWCGPYNGVRVPCHDETLGFWLGEPAVVYGYYTGGRQTTALTGCWARTTQAGPRPQPDWSFPLRGDDTGGPGKWFILSCLGEDGTWPGVATGVATVWLHTADLLPQGGPDPEGIARRALARIGLSAPEVATHPPASGSVLLGMPVWLATTESDQTWGPISDSRCEQGLCVSITARVVRIVWEMGDGAVVTCNRGQNVAWRPGVDLLSPGPACHHVYATPSRDEPEGRYLVTATTSWRVDWSGGGRSGSFVDVDDACGPGGEGTCQSTTGVRVDELQVLVQP